MTLHRKSIDGIEIKDGDLGQVVAVFSRYNVIDKDGDVTLPGAIQGDTEIVISNYGHSSWGSALPVGKGVIKTFEDRAEVHAQFFMGTSHGRDAFETVKELGSLGEWSYGFEILDAAPGTKDGRNVQFLKSLAVFEASPVMRGAGVQTVTVGTKAEKTYSDEGNTVLAGVDSLLTRTEAVLALRAAKGKGLGDESTDLLKQIEVALSRLKGLLVEPQVEDTQGDSEMEFLRFVSSQITREQ